MASLLLAVSAGNLSETKRLLDNGYHPDSTQNSNGHTPIFLAAHLGHKDIFQLLLSAGASVHNVTDKAGNSMLHLANHADVANTLISLNLDINGRNQLGRTPLHCAILRRNFEVANILLEHGCDVNAQDIDGNTSLHLISKCYFYMNMDILRSTYAVSKVNDRNYIMSYMKGRQVGGFHYALLEHDQDLFDYICHVAKFYTIPPKEEQILEKLNSHTDFLTLSENLIANGGDPVLSNHLGEVPLHLAVDGSNIELIRLLCKVAPSTVNKQDCMGKTPLLRCYSLPDNYHNVESKLKEEIEKQRKEMILGILIENGADLELVDVNGFGLLYFASHSYDYLKGVLKYTPNIDIRSCTGASVLHLLASETNTLDDKVITLLLKMGLNINCRDNYGATPLFYASWSSNTPWIELLLKHGCQIDALDNAGNTAADLALFNKHMDMVTLLTSHLPKSDDQAPPAYACQPKKHEGSLSTQEVKESSLNICEKNVVAVEDSSDVDKMFKSVILPKEGSQYICDLLESPVTGRTNSDEENVRIKEAVMYLITEIAKQFETYDPRFKMRVELSGSVSEGVKCGRADEFDILCCLEAFENLLKPEETETDPPGFVRIVSKLPNADYKEFFTEEGYLISSKLEETFYKCLYKALHSPDVWKSTKEHFPSLCYVPELTVKGPSADLTLRWFGPKFKDLFISIDMVPAFHFGQWWPAAATSHLEGLGDLNTNGCHVVLTTYHDKQHKQEDIAFDQQVPRHFRISFSQAERKILQSVPQEVRDGFILAKTLREECPPLRSAFPRSNSESSDSDEDEFEMYFESSSGDEGDHADMQSTMPGKETIVDQDMEGCEASLQVSKGVLHEPEVKLSATLISTYMLKMSLFHELQRAELTYLSLLSNANTPVNSMKACDWAGRIYHTLQTFVKNGSLPSFFLPGFDLMNRKDSSDFHVFEKSMISEEEQYQKGKEGTESEYVLSEEHQSSFLVLQVPNEINDFKMYIRQLYEIEDSWYSARDNKKRAEMWTKLRKFSYRYQEELTIFILLIQKILTECARVH